MFVHCQEWGQSARAVLDSLLLRGEPMERGSASFSVPDHLRADAYDPGPLLMPLLLEATEAGRAAGSEVNYFFYQASADPCQGVSVGAHPSHAQPSLFAQSHDEGDTHNRIQRLFFYNSFLSPFDMKLLLEECGGLASETLSRLPLNFDIPHLAYVDARLKLTRALRKRFVAASVKPNQCRLASSLRLLRPS